MSFHAFGRLASCALAATLLSSQMGAQPAHLIKAQQLLTQLNSSSSNTNYYGTTIVNPMDGTSAHIDWSGSPMTAISECSTFFSLLMEQTYCNNSESLFKPHTGGHPSPTAAM